MQKRNSNFITLETFQNRELVNGFTTKNMGNMGTKQKAVKQLRMLIDFLEITQRNVIGMDQVHGKKLAWVTKKQGGKIIKNTDGLLTKEKDIFLYGTFADCVPILIFDKKQKFTGVVHAGWKGALINIAGSAIDEMREKGSSTKDIIVGIGPSIKVCCYEVLYNRVKLFKKAFPQWEKKIIQKREGKYFLDLPNLITLQLVASGISINHIEQSTICTAVSKDFYSFRAQKGNSSYERFAAIIARV